MSSMRKTLTIAGMTCGHCVAAVRRALGDMPGVDVEDVSIGTATVRVADPTITDARLAAVLDEEGYRLDRVDQS